MGEEQRLPRRQVRLDRFRVEAALCGVGHEHHDHVRLGAGGRRIHHPQSLCLCLRHAQRGRLQSDPNVDAGVAQVESVGMTLRAEAQHGHLLRGDDGQIGVVFVEHVGHGYSCVDFGLGMSLAAGEIRRSAWCDQ